MHLNHVDINRDRDRRCNFVSLHPMITPQLPVTDVAATCRSCGTAVNGNFCAECGEKRFSKNDKSLLHLLDEMFHFFTHFEGKFFTTLKTMFRFPGKASRDYVSGMRKKYYKPVSFYLLLVIAYLVFPMFEGLNMRLPYHYGSKYYGDYAVQVAASVKERTGYSEEQLTEAFHQKGEKTSKFLLLIVIPIMAAASYLMAFKKTSYFYDHFIFASEVSSFYLLFGYLIMPLLLYAVYATGWKPFKSEEPVAAIMYGITALYVAIASGRFFGFPRWARIAYAVAFTLFLAIFISHVYKFILFKVVMWLL